MVESSIPSPIAASLLTTVDTQNDMTQDDVIDEDASLNAANGWIQSKGLMRFRLCPFELCFDHFGTSCSNNFGEYVVNMYTFIAAYVEWQMDIAEYTCCTYRSTCYQECLGPQNANCYTKCYKKYGAKRL